MNATLATNISFLDELIEFEETKKPIMIEKDVSFASYFAKKHGMGLIKKMKTKVFKIK